MKVNKAKETKKHTLQRIGAVAILLMTTLPAQAQEGTVPIDGNAAHAKVFSKTEFPSAQECGVCHPDHYREWSVSPHAYAQISPTFLAYQGTLGFLTNGSLGDFCQRCHSQTGMSMGEPIMTSNRNRSEVAKEGISCVVCHRVKDAYGKITGRFPLESGNIRNPIYGPHEDDEFQRVLNSPEQYKGFSTTPGNPGRAVHSEARVLQQISEPGFCGRCHDVRLVDGFRLEDAFSEYKQTAAAKRGESCQDCHMGPTPGVASAYPLAPAAVVSGVPTRPARRTNHMFAGPDDPLVHPGIFPIDLEAQEQATPMDWTSFDYKAGWGTEDFENTKPPASQFPEVWSDADERYYAREILQRQLELRAEAHDRGTALLRRGYGLGEIKIKEASPALRFEVQVRNLTDAHSVPTGLIVERNVFLQVTVTDADAQVVFRSGDLDPNGDVRDAHSLYVHHDAIPRDKQLFNLRSPFLVRTVHGGEREQVLPANYSVDPLLFVRPSPTPSLLFGGIRGKRLQKRNIEASGHRWARYRVDPDQLTGKAPYTANIKLVAGQLPPHLIHTISGVGLEYGMSAREIADGIVDHYRVLWERDVVITTDVSDVAESSGTSPTAGHETEISKQVRVPEGRDAVTFYDQGNSSLPADADPLRISDQASAYPAVQVKRPRPLLEIGPSFLGNGPIRRGVKTPTGQLLQPWFLVYGTMRSAIQSFGQGHRSTDEWATRLDLHGNLNLSGTERLVISMRPFESDDGDYSGFEFGSSTQEQWREDFNGTLTRLFFEGELGEIFPGLDNDDSSTWDWGFSVGRQPIDVQDGLLINDIIDLVGITRNSLTLGGVPNLRLTGIYGWNDVNRGNNAHQETAQLFGLLSSADTPWDATVSADVLYIDDSNDQTSAWYVGLGSTQRMGSINTTFRVSGSIPVHDDTPQAGSGALLFTELSHTRSGSDNVIYFNSFWNINRFTSASRGDDQGTAPARLGVLYSPMGMGRYGTPLGQPVEDTVGSVLGYQKFIGGIRSQIIFELGGRTQVESDAADRAVGFAVRYQRALGRRFLIRLDSFAAAHAGEAPSRGAHIEWMSKF